MERDNNIKNLIQAITDKYGLEPFNDSFPPIAEELISPATVQRVWKYPSLGRISISTLDILAKSIGYDSYRVFLQYKKNHRKVHKAIDGTIFTLFSKHQDVLSQAVDAFVEEGYLAKDSETNCIRWIKEPWKRQEFACWITEISYLVDADKEDSYHLIKEGTFCEVSSQTFMRSFIGLPSDLTDANLREAVSNYRKQITHTHQKDQSFLFSHDELYRLSVKEVLKNEVGKWNEYDSNGDIKKIHTFKRTLYLPILSIIDKIRQKNPNTDIT